MALNRTRTAAASAFATGLQFAMYNPLIALLLVESFGATPAQVGLVLTTANAAAFAVAFLVPRYADATGDFRRPLAAAGAFGLALVAALAFAPSLPWAAVALVVCTGPAMVGMSLFWGFLRSGGTPPRAIVHLRSLYSLYSLAWVVGPPAAAILAQARGARAVLVAVAAASVALVARLTGRLSTTALVAGGCAAGAAYYLGMALAPNVAVALVQQPLNAAFYAVVAGVGLTWFGEVIPGAAFAAGAYANTMRVGSVLAGGLIALASALGYAGVFAACGVLCALVLAAVLWVGRRPAAPASAGSVPAPGQGTAPGRWRQR